jgi:hypothetical protein
LPSPGVKVLDENVGQAHDGTAFKKIQDTVNNTVKKVVWQGIRLDQEKGRKPSF